MTRGRRFLGVVVFVTLAGDARAGDDLRSVERKLGEAKRAREEISGAATGVLGEIETLDRRTAQSRAELARVVRDVEKARDRSRQARAELARLDRDRARLDAALLARAPGLQRITRRGLGPLLFEAAEDRETRVRHRRYVASITARDGELLHAVIANREAAAKERAAAQDAETRLVSLRKERAAAVARIEKEKREKENRLASLRTEGERKDQLVRELESAAERLREILRRRPPLAKVRTAAPTGWRWPLDEVRSSEPLRNGIELSAARGTPVRAVAPGTVVFADWFPGYGRILVVDHGGHWHSIYGHTEEVLAATGESVTAGQAIATVGSTGATGNPSLYFELRRRGEPRDPASVLGERRVEK